MMLRSRNIARPNFENIQSDEDISEESVHNSSKSENNGYQSESESSVISDELVSESEVLSNYIESDEEESSDSEQEKTSDSGEKIVSRDGTSWFTTPVSNKGRRSSHDIIKKKPGLTAYSRNIETVDDAFDLLIFDEIIEIIVQETNAKALNVKNGENWTEVTTVEMKAFIGLLILMGICKGRREPLWELWGTKNRAFQRPVFSATMSRERFKEIYRFIRFDNFLTREERQKESKLAAFENVFNIFIGNCERAYNPESDLCIDEELVAFRGCCSFKVYMKSKPDRYGIKIWTLCDATNSYVWNQQIYSGKIFISK